ncbi:NAD(P)(+)--arginine ADP-ribosyltransferase 2-like isoform X2 [Colossoma macropomum]|uniref:NAD(P)(+)--arginine ADP-ribosyltransferase 2-like isoform X2 n=1 Tax=Colossoma macropomum TaxID=42526 RepID=UPI0018640F8F|nr:NAD(P)(+)--arginine ADP-ribosyltransferase 2-like isoform X2 [Colossoma macropomum]
MKMLLAAAMIHLNLFLILILTVHTALAVRSGIIEMDEYPNSIDDEFEKCHEQMYKKITDKNPQQNLLEIELSRNANFSAAWNNAKHELNLTNNDNYKLSNDKLREIALRAYTRNEIYRQLNCKMRTGKETYKTDFGLISLHFLITDGIQNLPKTCTITYRTMDVPVIRTSRFVRFGSFGSSSHNPTLHFGRETCFIIKTCHGADISNVSEIPAEAEVLIPPYEKFKSERVLNIQKEFRNRYFPPIFCRCKYVYKLESAGTMSNMKCELVGKTERKRFSFFKKLKKLFGRTT